MAVTCLVLGCRCRSNRDKVGFYSVPAHQNGLLIYKNELSRKRRDLWLDAVKRDDLTYNKIKYQRVCSKHFISGKPTSIYDVNNPDWVPSQNMIQISTKVPKKVNKIHKKKRVLKGRKLKQKLVENDDVGAEACANENKPEEKVYILLINLPMNQNSPTNVPS